MKPNPAKLTPHEHKLFVAANEIGEPVTRTDGTTVRMFESPYPGIELHAGSLQMFYDDEELEVLGDGNRERGIRALGKAAFIGERNDDEESYEYETRFLDSKLYAARDEDRL